jgi:hypothetical protein
MFSLGSLALRIELSHGSLPVAEKGAIALPFLSWTMLLVGDLLYRPF